LVDVRDNSGNAMARVQAAKTLEQISEEENQRHPAGAFVELPGLQIIILPPNPPALPAGGEAIDVTPATDRAHISPTRKG
jgi:hypothetical protein